MSQLEAIMHVDDDADILEITRIALSVLDQFTLHQFDSGPKALEALGDVSPDLLLLDLMMPDMTGKDLWGAIKNRDPIDHPPAVFMTAAAEDAMREELIAEGALGVIAKPFDPTTLGNQLRSIWAERS